MDRRVLAAVAALVILVLAAATFGGVYAYQQSLPTTASFNLKDGQREVRLDQRLGIRFTRAVTAAAVTSIANSAPERELVAGLVADVTGTDRASVPNWASLLVGPLLRGVEVQVR